MKAVLRVAPNMDVLSRGPRVPAATLAACLNPE